MTTPAATVIPANRNSTPPVGKNSSPAISPRPRTRSNTSNLRQICRIRMPPIISAAHQPMITKGDRRTRSGDLVLRLERAHAEVLVPRELL